MIFSIFTDAVTIGTEKSGAKQLISSLKKPSSV